jgi:hypothetical protein
MCTRLTPLRTVDAVCRQHHVESVHLAAANGRALHAALAIVQTPARAFWVLRANGLPIGCEDAGGVADAWQALLWCNAEGVPV